MSGLPPLRDCQPCCRRSGRSNARVAHTESQASGHPAASRSALLARHPPISSGPPPRGRRAPGSPSRTNQDSDADRPPSRAASQASCPMAFAARQPPILSWRFHITCLPGIASHHYATNALGYSYLGTDPGAVALGMDATRLTTPLRQATTSFVVTGSVSPSEKAPPTG